MFASASLSGEVFLDNSPKESREVRAIEASEADMMFDVLSSSRLLYPSLSSVLALDLKRPLPFVFEYLDELSFLHLETFCAG